MHTEYYLLTVDVTVQGPVTLTAATQGRRKERLGPKQNPSQIETGFASVLSFSINIIFNSFCLPLSICPLISQLMIAIHGIRDYFLPL